MKQVIYDKAGRVRVQTVPVPSIGSGELLIKNEYSAISAGTERSMVDLMKKPLWKMAVDRPDLAKQVIKFAKDSGVKKTMDLVKSRLDVWHLLGYSSAGTVVRFGDDVKDFSVGDRVACVGSGAANHAEYVAVPKTLVAKIPKGVDTKDASFTGIACIALQSVRQLNPSLGETIVVIGLGLIGQMVAQMLRANGCKVIGVDIDKAKTERKYIDSPISEDSIRSVSKVTGGIGADGVIIAAATEKNLVNDAFDMCRKKGRVVLLGISGMEIDRQKMFEKELEFKISTSFGAGAFDVFYEQMGREYPIEHVRWTSQRNMEAVLELIRTKKLDMSELKPEIYEIKDAQKAYKSTNPIGLFRYNAEEPQATIEVNKTINNKKPKVAIIGAGQFVKGFLIPAMKKSGMNVYAVATKSGTDASKTAKELGARYASSEYKDLIKDKSVDLIVVGSRHDSHAQISIEALKAGRNVYSEKPMAINEKEFSELKKAIRSSKNIYTCGFNRRYSNAALKMKEKLSDGPMIMNYIFNNTYLPDDHWVNIPDIGGGRIIGEACHIIDLFNFFTGSTPVLVSSAQISTTDQEANDSNNISTVIKYKDGSICTLTYSCIGSANVERERCTIIQNGKVLEMDGFGSVKMNNRTIYSGSADLGYNQEFREIADALAGKENRLATAEECISATETVFRIVKGTK